MAAKTKEELRKEANEAAKKLMPDELDTRKDACPYCNFDGVIEETGEKRTKRPNLVRNCLGKFQCDVCGKLWERTALGKPYTLALERGEAWERAQRIRGLNEGRAL